MRAPKGTSDLSDLSKFITREDSIVKAWCVECEHWSQVIVVASATVTYHQNHWPAQTEDARDPGFYCGARGCWADVGYLLDEAHKEIILTLANVPIHRRGKAPAAQISRKIAPRQLRMEI